MRYLFVFSFAISACGDDSYCSEETGAELIFRLAESCDSGEFRIEDGGVTCLPKKTITFEVKNGNN